MKHFLKGNIMNFRQHMKFMYGFLIALCLMGFTQRAFALPDLFHPIAHGQDLLVNFIIEPLIDKNNQGNAIAAVSSIFLQGLLVIGAILFIYTIITSTTNTALQGELMGKKSAMSYTVARNVMGVGMIIPFTGGFAVIQHIVIWLAVQGVYLGDKAWENFVDNQPLNTQVIINKSVSLKIIDSMKPIVLSHLCYLEMEERAKRGVEGYRSLNMTVTGGNKLGELHQSLARDPNYKSAYTLFQAQMNNDNLRSANNLTQHGAYTKKILESKVNSISIGYVDRSKPNLSREMTEGFCGQFALLTQKVGSSSYEEVKTISNGEKSKKNTYINDLSSGNINFLRSVANIIDLDGMKNRIQDLHEEEYAKLIGSGKNGQLGYAKDIAQAIFDNPRVDEAVIAQKIVDKANQYMTSIANGAMKEAEKFSKETSFGNGVADAMKKDGIASAGAWYWAIVSQGSNLTDVINTPPILITNKIVDFNDKNNVLLNAKPQIDSMNPSSGSGGSSGSRIDNVMLSSALSNADAKLDRALYLITDSNVYANTGLTMANASYNQSRENGKIIQLFTGEKVAPIGVEDFLYKADENPVITVHKLGKKVLFWFTLVLDGAAGGTLGASGASLLFPFIIGMLIPAIVMVYYIPLLPFVLWMGSLIGWVVMVIQALFGAPLWMLAHLIPDKESFIGRQGQGYMMILSLFIRPILMVIGLVVSLQLLNPIGKLINSFFGFTALTVLGGVNLMWLIGLLAVLGIYAMVLQNTVKKIFSLIHVIPDSLLQWFGGNDQKILGEYANGIEQGAQQGLGQMGSGLSTIGHRMAMGGGMVGGMSGAVAGAAKVAGASGTNTARELNGMSGMGNIGGNATSSGSGNANNPLSKGLDEITQFMHGTQDKPGAMARMAEAERTGVQPSTPTLDGMFNQAFGGPIGDTGILNNVGGQGRTLEQMARNESNFGQAKTDYNAWSNLGENLQKRILDSGATNFADSSGRLHMVPPELLSPETRQSIKMTDAQVDAVTSGRETSVNRMVNNSGMEAAQSRIEQISHARDQAIYNGNTFDVAKGEVFTPAEVSVSERYKVK